MQPKKDEVRASSGWLSNGHIGGRYGYALDVLTFVPGIVLGFVAIHYRFGVPLSNRTLMLLTLPSFSGFIAAIFRSRFRWLAAGVAAATYWGMSVTLLILGLQGFTLFFLFLLPLIMLVFTALTTTVFMGLRIGFLWPLLVSMAGLLIGTVATASLLSLHDQTMHPVRAQDPVPLGQDFLKINKCTHQFRLSHPESGYPESLLQLGPQGSACIPQALVNSQYKGFVLSYEAGDKDAGGKISTYVMKAEQASPRGPNFSVMSTDESGLIQYSYRGPLAGNRSYAYASPGGTFDYLIDCLKQSSTANKTDLNAADRAVQACWKQNMHLDTSRTATGWLSSPCFDITYKFTSDNPGFIDGFIVTGRPKFYGDCGIRSYLLEGNGANVRMYATPDDRPATRSDPAARMCELKERADCNGPAEIK
jgi:hypothetical protein